MCIDLPDVGHVPLELLGEIARLLGTIPRDELEMSAAAVEAVTRDLDRPAGRRPTAALALLLLEAMVRGADPVDELARLLARDPDLTDPGAP